MAPLRKDYGRRRRGPRTKVASWINGYPDDCRAALAGDRLGGYIRPIYPNTPITRRPPFFNTRADSLWTEQWWMERRSPSGATFHVVVQDLRQEMLRCNPEADPIASAPYT